MNPQLIVRPLGGVSQIGSNMTQISGGSSHVIIDCGILFPYEDAFDINYLIPDFAGVAHLTKKLNLETSPEALIFTHGHEDHIGAVFHFIETFPQTPLYATNFTAALINEKLERLGKKKKVHIISPNQTLSFDDFTITPIHVNHSIPDTTGLLIHSPQTDTHLFYCSDFKVDLEDHFEPKFDLTSLSNKIKDSMQRIVLADSTNILSSQHKTLSEKDLYPDLYKLISDCPGRAFVTSFASNVNRMQTIFNIANELNKRVVLYGNAMKKYSFLAKQTGHLETYSQDRDVDQIDPNATDLIVLASGCQGDFKSAVRRIAMNEDRNFKLRPSDFFIFSSKSIPGNEKKIGLLANSLIESDVRVFFSGEEHQIHASGHAGRQDLKLLYDSVRPTHILPIHGESLFLQAHREFIKKNYGQTETLKFYNGDEIIIERNKVFSNPHENLDPILIHGDQIPIERSLISQRRKIAQNGIFLLSITQNKNNFKFQFDSYGIPTELIPSEKKVETLIKSCIKLKNREEEIRIRLRRLMNERLGYKPITHVFLHPS